MCSKEGDAEYVFEDAVFETRTNMWHTNATIKVLVLLLYRI